MNFLKRILRKLKPSKSLKYGHQNHTHIKADCVVKGYVGRDADSRFKSEVLALSKFQKYIPLPELVHTDEESLKIQTRFVQGINGADVSPHMMTSVQFESGQLLKKIHSIPLKVLEGQVKGEGSSILHGDYTIRNLIVSKSNYSILAILDWEKLRIGEPMRDLYWYEWVLRKSSSTTFEHLNSFFRGYGIETPNWEVRQSSILGLLQEALDQAESENYKVGIHYWQQEYAITQQLSELQ